VMYATWALISFDDDTCKTILRARGYTPKGNT
jgi:hypothetical protein